MTLLDDLEETVLATVTLPTREIEPEPVEGEEGAEGEEAAEGEPAAGDDAAGDSADSGASGE